MANDPIMIFGSILFAILFAFLMLVFFTTIIAFFKKEEYPDFEPKVSVIIPCYNEEKNIKRCLESVFALQYPKEKLEVIVVVDGSTDQTRKIVREMQEKFPQIQLIHGNHEGKSASLNKGVKHARYEILFCLDADTFINQDSLKKLVRPLQLEEVGATNGSCIAENTDSLISIFQRIEYHYNNLIRRSFSVLFKNGIWFFGAFACYKKEVLTKIGYFKQDTMTEDMDTAMEIYQAGYRTVNVFDALGYTKVPHSLRHFYKQRSRWWIGALQTLKKNKALFSKQSSPSILFLFVSQYWWSLYAFLSFPIIAYQIYYWLPSNTESFFTVFMYFFRWFTLAGPVYVLYKLPEWGLSFLNIFGVLSGVISVFLIIRAIYLFHDKLSLKNMLGIFLYFPYTIILNTIIVTSMINLLFIKKKYFIYD